jgi:anti-sigma regulatory factor (Ser/Thr protein kinase)/DNA-binding response OmpR family regulator
MADADISDVDEMRVLLLAPTGRDAPLAADALRAAGLRVAICASMDDLTAAFLSEGAGAAVIAYEALTPPALDALDRMLSWQPPWSDLPLIVLSGNGRTTEAGEALLQSSERLGNATFLERPLRIATLVRAIRVALRSRRRQYEIRGHLEERERAAAERLALMEQQRVVLRDVLTSVTEGKLRLCDAGAELPPRAPEVICDALTLDARNLRFLRREVLRAAEEAGIDGERCDDLVTAVNEAGMNAVVHGGGGTGSVYADPERGTVQVWIEDRGKGIDMARLPRATLERGYSSAGTLGHGFWMMLTTADRTYLCTGPNGTTLVVEQDRTPPEPSWMRRVPTLPPTDE